MSDAFAWYGGLDFSGAREPLSNLWTTVAREVDGRLVVESIRPHAFRADLSGFVASGWRTAVDARDDERILWGADFPFGVPAAAARDLCGAGADWRRLLAWVADRPADEVKDAVPEPHRGPRATDTGGAMSPFDLRLYKQSVEGMRWLHELLEEEEIAVLPQRPADAPTTLVEVYPSGAAQELGLPRRRSPSRPGEVRARAAALRTFLSFADPGCEALAVTLEDAWDSTVACLCAWLCRDDLDQPFQLSPIPEAELRLEGWIYRPPVTLAPPRG